MNEEEAVPLFCREIDRVRGQLQGVDTRLLFVDDGSTDKTLAVLKAERAKDETVRYLSFSRNFGKEAAIFAGLEATKDSTYVAIMDVDLQDPPQLLPEMLAGIREGYDCVATRRSTRKGEPPIRSFFAHRFYRLMARISNTPIMDGARDYRLMTRQVADAIISMREYNRFLKGIYGWVGFRTKWLSYENVPRSAGRTKWSFWKLFRYSIEGIVGFSTAPLSFVSSIGIVFCMVSFIALMVFFIRALIWGDPVPGWPSLVCIISFLGGVQLLCLGIVGLYLSKTYLETKNRPIYIIRETSGETPEEEKKTADGLQQKRTAGSAQQDKAAGGLQTDQRKEGTDAR